jgi:hypothetical protein
MKEDRSSGPRRERIPGWTAVLAGNESSAGREGGSGALAATTGEAAEGDVGASFFTRGK